MQRSRLLNKQASGTGPVIYWMSRDQRVYDNWAFIEAQQLAKSKNRPFIVFFGLSSTFPGANGRHFDFMLRGLAEVSQSLSELNIPFVLRKGDPVRELQALVNNVKAHSVVCDFDPVRIKKQWKQLLINQLPCPLIEVDAHNIVPCWTASDKQEYGAYTLRPKLKRLIPSFLQKFPEPEVWRGPSIVLNTGFNADVELANLTCDWSVPVVNNIAVGEKAAREQLSQFIDHGLHNYGQLHNDPTKNGVSHLSAWLHFGQLSAQRVALEVIAAGLSPEITDPFLEQLIIRRELADNFCHYNEAYDSFEGFPAWAKMSLLDHLADEREVLYSLDTLETAQTHDELWNAAQQQMVTTGYMHNYLRMYWAKKILEWTPSPATALNYAVILNDKYELDGRDPNGYTGCAWAIGGVHDRPWFDRPVFGKIRYMNYNGCRSKFDVDRFIVMFSTK